jgi:hypothetical protein
LTIVDFYPRVGLINTGIGESRPKAEIMGLHAHGVKGGEELEAKFRSKNDRI